MKNKLFQGLCSLVTAVVISGCAALGPVDSPQFPALIAQAIPAADGAAQITGSGIWYPNTRGFTDLRNLMLGRPVDPIPGAFIITDNAVLFAQWDEQKSAFDVIKRITIRDVASVAIDSYGAGRRLVVRNSDLSYQTFQFTRASGNLGDAEKTEQAAVFLNSKLAPIPR